MSDHSRRCPYCGMQFTLDTCRVVASSQPSQGANPFADGEADSWAQPPSRVLWSPYEPPTAGRAAKWSWLATNQQKTPDLSNVPPEVRPRRECPKCRQLLPNDIDTRHAHIVGVVGLNVAGKSNYIATALTAAARQRGLADIGVHEFEADVETANRFQRDYYTPLFRNNRVLDGTQVDELVRLKPLIFRVTPADTTPLLLLIHDVAGEALVDPRSRAETTSFLRRASGLIFLLDPTEFDGLRDTLPSDSLTPDRDIDQVDLLAQMLHELAPGSDVPVAVTIGKADLLNSARTAGTLFVRERDPSADFIADTKDVHAQLRDFLLEIGERRIVSIVDEHDSATLHAVSALGSAPQGGRLDRVEPCRVLDPLGTVVLRLAARLT